MSSVFREGMKLKGEGREYRFRISEEERLVIIEALAYYMEFLKSISNLYRDQRVKRVVRRREPPIEAMARELRVAEHLIMRLLEPRPGRKTPLIVRKAH